MLEENTTNLYISLEDEMLKLLTIIESENTKDISRHYVAGKIIKALAGSPIILHPGLVFSYKRLKEKLSQGAHE